MFKYTTAFVLLFCSSVAQADHWFCTDESSQRTDNIVKACGIGLAKTEPVARRKALRNAGKEFLQLCSLSNDCMDHNISSKPLRTDCQPGCDKYGCGFICYRMVEFTIESSR
jgi:hypothetical protein